MNSAYYTWVMPLLFTDVTEAKGKPRQLTFVARDS